MGEWLLVNTQFSDLSPELRRIMARAGTVCKKMRLAGARLRERYRGPSIAGPGITFRITGHARVAFHLIRPDSRPPVHSCVRQTRSEVVSSQVVC